jgi:hypothetical protein
VLAKPRSIVKPALFVLVALAAFSPGATAATPCPDGTTRCVTKTIKDMQARYDVQAPACDHNVIFSLSYLLTTEQYKIVTQDPSFFHDTPWVNKEDWNFAKLYMNAMDAYRPHTTIAGVPAAWQIALDAAHDQAVTGSGDLLLGINAHVNRDLPFALYQMGLVAPDGSSRQADHEKVNVMLRQALPKILAYESKRFDPTIPNDVVMGTDMDLDGLMSLLVAWRESAWDNAVLLATAPNATIRNTVAATIESQAATEARTLRTATLATSAQRAARNAYCAAHWNAA